MQLPEYLLAILALRMSFVIPAGLPQEAGLPHPGFTGHLRGADSVSSVQVMQGEERLKASALVSHQLQAD